MRFAWRHSSKIVSNSSITCIHTHNINVRPERNDGDKPHRFLVTKLSTLMSAIIANHSPSHCHRWNLNMQTRPSLTLLVYFCVETERSTLPLPWYYGVCRSYDKLCMTTMIMVDEFVHSLRSSVSTFSSKNFACRTATAASKHFSTLSIRCKVCGDHIVSSNITSHQIQTIKWDPKILLFSYEFSRVCDDDDEMALWCVYTTNLEVTVMMWGSGGEEVVNCDSFLLIWDD